MLQTIRMLTVLLYNLLDIIKNKEEMLKGLQSWCPHRNKCELPQRPTSLMSLSHQTITGILEAYLLIWINRLIAATKMVTILDSAEFKWRKKIMITEKLLICQCQLRRRPPHRLQRMWSKGKTNSAIAPFQKEPSMRWQWIQWIWRNIGKSKLESAFKLSPSTRVFKVTVAIDSPTNLTLQSTC